jgi:hypothetical protein
MSKAHSAALTLSFPQREAHAQVNRASLNYELPLITYTITFKFNIKFWIDTYEY